VSDEPSAHLFLASPGGFHIPQMPSASPPVGFFRTEKGVDFLREKSYLIITGEEGSKSGERRRPSPTVGVFDVRGVLV
jgi:hypothetical protein